MFVIGVMPLWHLSAVWDSSVACGSCKQLSKPDHNHDDHAVQAVQNLTQPTSTTGQQNHWYDLQRTDHCKHQLPQAGKSLLPQLQQ